MLREFSFKEAHLKLCWRQAKSLGGFGGKLWLPNLSKLSTGVAQRADCLGSLRYYQLDSRVGNFGSC